MKGMIVKKLKSMSHSGISCGLSTEIVINEYSKQIQHKKPSSTIFLITSK